MNDTTITGAWQLVSTNVAGNIHSATGWINGTGLAGYVMHIEFSGSSSIVVFKVPSAIAPKVREALGNIPESWPNKPIFKEWKGIAP